MFFLLWKNGKKLGEILDLLRATHGDKRITLRTIQLWLESFNVGRTILADKRSDRPCSHSRESLIKQVEALLQKDARLTVREIADSTNSPSTTIFRINRGFAVRPVLCPLDSQQATRWTQPSLLHDNARPHTALHAKEAIQKLKLTSYPIHRTLLTWFLPTLPCSPDSKKSSAAGCSKTERKWNVKSGRHFCSTFNEKSSCWPSIMSFSAGRSV